MTALTVILFLLWSDPCEASYTDENPLPSNFPPEISRIDFQGNLFIGSEKLRSVIALGDQLGAPQSIVLGRPSLASFVDYANHKIEKQYKSFGFFDVEVTHELRWDADHRMAQLCFRIQEGKRHRVETVRIMGCKSIELQTLLPLMKLREGNYYSRQDAEEDVATIKDSLGNLGIDARVYDEVLISATGVRLTGVRVTYDFLESRESRPSRVGTIKIVGNDKTPRHVILDQIPLRPGELLRYPALYVAERNLAKLGIFEVNSQSGQRPTVMVLDPDSDDSVKNILVEVREIDATTAETSRGSAP